ncbi:MULTISPECIES: HNH endonuclease [unclassified Ruegeria]|uniref:HNH endonuclease n=1 Tax=unclassified Ruegeria TaxID=2625375 RepID=UPI0014894DBA|nr:MULTISPECIES: HNH endonuclease signature motif containing protein [unclassified Ruegeria]
MTFVNGEKVYDLSTAERQAIHTVYSLYEDLLGQPHPNLTPTELDSARSALHDAYGQLQIGGRLEYLRERLLASTDECPLCGFGEPSQLDHYLPRSIFGELSIYVSNLVPCCGPCNNAKRTVVPGLGPACGPGFIHPYFQELPERDFLLADVNLEANTLAVSFRINQAEIDANLAAKLQFQLDRLKLNKRYRKQINKFLNEQRTAILLLAGSGPNSVGEFLHVSANNLVGTFHRNDWRVSLFRSLADTPQFCANPERYLGVRAGDTV